MGYNSSRHPKISDNRSGKSKSELRESQANKQDKLETSSIPTNPRPLCPREQSLKLGRTHPKTSKRIILPAKTSNLFSSRQASTVRRTTSLLFSKVSFAGLISTVVAPTFQSSHFAPRNAATTGARIYPKVTPWYL